MSFITCDWSGTMPFKPSISPLSFVTSLARSPAAAGATGPAGCAVPARAAPPASEATATKITTVLSHERMHSSHRLDRAGLLPGDKGHERAAACREHDDEPRRRLPARGRDDLCLQQRKDDVASAKDQRPGAEKAVEDGERLGPHELAGDRQREQ